MKEARRVVAVGALALLLCAALDLLVFQTGLYRRLLDPFSSAGSLESSLAAVRRFPAEASRDVLVVGDSRIYSGLDPAVAARASHGLRFLNAGVPGTTPRCWYYYLRAVDPHATRFRALVIPVDTYADDDSAIGALDGNDRDTDLHYLAFRIGPSAALRVASSFNNLTQAAETAFSVIFRYPLVAADVRDLLVNPLARLNAIRAARAVGAYDPLVRHRRTEVLTGLRFDPRTGTLVIPAFVSAAERAALRTQILRRPRSSPSYAAYRREWLGPIVQRYRAAGVPVIFVRIPTRPLHIYPPAPPSGTLLAFARDDGAWLLPQRRFLALERPAFFADHDHLNAAGSVRFSELLGAAVARAIANGGTPLPAAARAIASVAPRAQHSAAPAVVQPSSPSVFGTIDLQMRFQSPVFWLFFLIVAALFYAVPRRMKWVVLLVASYVFYASWNRWYVIFLLALTVSDYAFALAIERARRGRRTFLTLGVAANLAFLGTFKYMNFATGTIAALLGRHGDPWLVHLIVPIGISFHTFQSISYLVDVYRGKMRAMTRLFDYALYLAFFPQLLAGPIVRAETFFAEYVAWRAPNAEDLSYGAMRAIVGLVKKIAVADQFAPISDRYFAHPALYPGALDAWAGLFAFTMQIYFDFSGYSDIAIGCARLLGFVFPKNFDRPYLSASITEFWHRWHITLSQWLRDYLYIPLGGNRDGTRATLRNLMLTMLLGGLWHGASWTFVAWGGYHGVLLCIERVTGLGRVQTRSSAVNALRVAITFVLAMLGWALFRARSFGEVVGIYGALFSAKAGAPLFSDWPSVLTIALAVIAIGLFVVKQRRLEPRWSGLAPGLQVAVLGSLLFVFQFFAVQPDVTPFVYFKF